MKIGENATRGGVNMKSKIDNYLIVLSIVAVVLSAYVSFSKSDVLSLAGTQWMLIAIVLGIYGMYAKMRAV